MNEFENVPVNEEPLQAAPMPEQTPSAADEAASAPGPGSSVAAILAAGAKASREMLTEAMNTPPAKPVPTLVLPETAAVPAESTEASENEVPAEPAEAAPLQTENAQPKAPAEPAVSAWTPEVLTVPEAAAAEAETVEAPAAAGEAQPASSAADAFPEAAAAEAEGTEEAAPLYGADAFEDVELTEVQAAPAADSAPEAFPAEEAPAEDAAPESPAAPEASEGTAAEAAKEEPESAAAEAEEADGSPEEAEPEEVQAVEENTEETAEKEPEAPGKPKKAPAEKAAFLKALKKKLPSVHNRTLGLVLGILLVMILATVLICSRINNQPMRLIRRGIAESREAVEQTAALQRASNLRNNGSVTLNADLSKLAGILGAKLDAGLSLTAYSEAAERSGALNLDVRLKGNTILDGTLFLSPREVLLASEALLGKTNYGVSIDNIPKNLPGSVLNPAEGSEYALSEQLYQALASMKNGPLAPLAGIRTSLKKAEESGMSVLSKAVESTAEIAVSKEVLELGENSINTKAVTLDLDEKALAALADQLIAWAADDQDLLAALNSFTENYGGLLTGLGQEDPAEGIARFYGTLKQLREDPSLLQKQLEGSRVTLIFYVNRSNRQLVKLGFTLKLGEFRYTGSLEGGPDWKSPALAALSLKDAAGDKTVISYTVEENSKNLFSSGLRIKKNADSITSGGLTLDKKTGSFSFSVGQWLDLTGSITEKGKITTVLLRQVDLSKLASLISFLPENLSSSLVFDDLGIALILNESAKLPQQPKYKDLLSMKESSLEDLISNLQDAVERISADAVLALYE